MRSSISADFAGSRAAQALALAKRAFAAFDQLAGEGPIGVAVSGGSDSTAMLVLLAQWAQERRSPIYAATVDHGLRAAAQQEAKDVSQLAERLGVPHETLVWRPEGRPGQALARRARHRLLAHWAHRIGATTVALGHTEDDRIETFLIRARGGSQWFGLAGPMPAAPSPASPEGRGLRLLRPLLAISRQALRDELRARAIGWIEDPANEASRYERVRMRRLAAHLSAKDRANIIGSMNRLAALRSAVVKGARDALAQTMPCVGEEAIRLPGELLWDLSIEVRLRLVEALLLAVDQAGRHVRSDSLRRLSEAMARPGGLGAGLTLSGVRVREMGREIDVRLAPPRRGELALTFDPAASLVRAGELLADPHLAALDV